MTKVITAWIEGPIEELLKVWNIPEDVSVDKQTSTELSLAFFDDKVDEFYRLEEAVQQHNLAVSIDPVFRAHSFTDDELLQAELMSLTGPSDEHIEVVRTSQDNVDIIRLIRHSGDTRLQRMFFPYGGLTVVHEDIINEMNRLDIDKGSVITPCRVEQDEASKLNWFALASSVNLGKSVRQRRFLPAFSRDRWNGEDVCQASDRATGMLYISQRLFRYIRSLPDYQQLKLDFRPVDLI